MTFGDNAPYTDAEMAEVRASTRKIRVERLLATIAACDAEIVRLKVPGALETGRNGGWQEMIETMRESKRRTNVENAALRARVAKLEAALRKIDVDMVGLHRFNADGLCSLCNNGHNGSSQPFCEACVAHNALEDQ